MKLFYVKIEKCSSEYYWYSEFVGCVFPVLYDSIEEKYVLESFDRWINVADARKVKVEYE